MHVSRRAMRTHCRKLIRDIPIPVPFNLATFVSTVAARRGRRIRLIATPLGGVVFGAWVACDVDDFIFYERNTTPFHQQQIVLHELGHILYGHVGLPVDADALAPYLPAEVIAQVRALRRDRYDDLEEYEAEVFAWVVLERAQQTRLDGEIADAGIVEALQLLDRLEGVDHED